MKFTYKPPPLRMWMVKTSHLAPFWGIARTRREFKYRGIPPNAKLVRVVVFEVDK